jgi:hypothetical protein
MNYLNKLRLNAGLPMDLALEAKGESSENQITEARETPKRRTELASKDKRSIKQQERGVKRAMEHIKQAITQLEKIPATDFRGEIPHFISELEDLLDGGQGGMEGYLATVADEGANFGKEPEPEMSDEPEMDDPADLDDEMDEPPMDIVSPDVDKGMGASAMESDEDDFLANLSPEAKSQLKAAISMLGMLSAGPMIKETMERIAVITGKPLEEAMHYYNVNYDSFEDTKDKDRPVNVSNGSSNDEQYMDDLPATKKEAPEQTRTMNQQDNSPQDKSGDDLANSFKTPNHIKKAIKDVIADMKKEAKTEAKRNQGRAKDAEWLYNDTANAFEEILAFLDAGTLYDFKLAQTKAQSLMGPMYHKIPTKVWKFLANGGEPRSLKSYMSEVPKSYQQGTVKK